MAARKSLNWKPILTRAKDIVNSYDTSVTRRQLFYRLVAAGLIPNKDSSYTYLSRLTTDGRHDGTFPQLIDSTRKIHQLNGYSSPESALHVLAHYYKRRRDEGQEYAVYLGVEKRTMIEQLSAWFFDYGVKVVPLGGFTSQSYIEVVLKEIADEAESIGRPSVFIYAGDLDASGIVIDEAFLKWLTTSSIQSG